jgi:ABC-type sulfate transport system substrate-binding protein
VDPLERLLQNSDSFDDFLAGLPAVMEEMDPAEVVRRMATTTFKARGLGDVSDEQDRE